MMCLRTWLAALLLVVACDGEPSASPPVRASTPKAYDPPAAANPQADRQPPPARADAAEARVYAEALAVIASKVEAAIAEAERDPPADAAAAKEVLKGVLPQSHLPEIGLALERAGLSTEQLRAWMEANPEAAAQVGAGLEARLAKQEPALERVLERVVTHLPAEDPTAVRLLEELRRRGALRGSETDADP